MTADQTPRRVPTMAERIAAAKADGSTPAIPCDAESTWIEAAAEALAKAEGSTAFSPYLPDTPDRMASRNTWRALARVAVEAARPLLEEPLRDRLVERVSESHYYRQQLGNARFDLKRVTADRDRLAAACTLIDRELTPHAHRAGMSPGHAAIAQALAATGWPGYRQERAQEDCPVCAGSGDEWLDPGTVGETMTDDPCPRCFPPRGQKADPASSGTLRTPDEWCAALGVTVHDADGWRDKSWSEPISRAEFQRRMFVSTIEHRPRAQEAHIPMPSIPEVVATLHARRQATDGPAPTPTPGDGAGGAQETAQRVVDAARAVVSAWRAPAGDRYPVVDLGAAEGDLAAAVDALGEGSADD